MSIFHRSNPFNLYRITTLTLTLIMLFAMAINGQTQSSSVLQGIVTDENKAIIPEAKIVLVDAAGVKRETTSDLTGKFSFGELPHGNYILVVSKEGFADKTIDLVLNGASERSNLTLEAGGVSESVTVVLDSSDAAADSTLKLGVSIHETPRSISVIGSKRIDEQNFRQVADALSWVPGTTQNSYRNGSYHFYSRGYRMGPEDTRQDGFSGVNVGSGGFGASTFGVEEIVVLKGPASLLYGQTGSPGGLINLISKRPQEKRVTRIDLRGAGYSGNGVSLGEMPSFGVDVDSTGAVTKNERILYRALFTLENMSYFTRDTLDRNRFANGSLLFKLDEEGRYVLTPSFQYTRYHRPYGGGVVASASGSLSANDGSTEINTDDLSPLDVNLFGGRRIEETAWAGLDFRGVVSEKIRVNAAYRFVSFDTDINSFTPVVSTAAQINQLRTANTVGRIQAKSLTERNYHNFNADASYEWIATPMFRNTTQIGFYSRSLNSRSTSPQGPVPGVHSPINIYTGVASSPLVDNFPALAFGNWGRDTVWNAFIQNRTSLDNGRWNITIGLNHGQNKPTSGAVRKSDLNPNVAVLFNATPELAFYGSYSTAFNPTDPNLQNANGVRGTFGPSTSSSFEAGAKYDLLNRRLGLAVAVFQNQIDNALVASDTFLNGERFYRPAGTRRSRGAEATGDYQVREDLRLSAGVAYTSAVYLGFPDGAVVGTSPIPNSWAEKTPRWSYNFYSRYDRREGYLRGFGAGFGVSWQGKRIGSNGAMTFGNPDPVVLPSFTKVDTALFYRLNRHVNFALNIDNLFDELIFVNGSVASNLEIAAPRTMTFRTSFSF